MRKMRYVKQIRHEKHFQNTTPNNNQNGNNNRTD